MGRCGRKKKRGGGGQGGRGTGCCALILVELKPTWRDYVLKYVASQSSCTSPKLCFSGVGGEVLFR